MLGVIGRSVADAASVLVRAVWLLGRHWPALVAIYLVGAIFHDGLLWFCVWLSNSHATWAGFVLPLVPLSTLTALILMLRVLNPDLAHVAPAVRALAEAAGGDPEQDPTGSPAATRTDRLAAARPGLVQRVRARLRTWRAPTQTRLALLASTLIPFLTVYVSQDWLKEDRDAFINAAVFDESREDIFFNAEAFDLNRIFIAQGVLLFGIVAIAFAIRWGMGRFGLAGRAVSLGLVAAYIEVLWVFLLAGQFDAIRTQVADWVAGRQLTAWVSDGWDVVVTLLGPVGAPVEEAVSWLWTALGQLDDVIVIPIAWLTVGAVVYGRTISARERARSEAAAARVERWQQRVGRVPAPVRRAGNEFTATVRDRFSSLGNGIRLLASAGLAPMLLFCVVFLLAAQVENGVEQLRRLLLGPMDAYDALAVTPMLSVISRGAYLVVLVVLLGAAVDRILARAEDDGRVDVLEEAGPPEDGVEPVLSPARG